MKYYEFFSLNYSELIDLLNNNPDEIFSDTSRVSTFMRKTNKLNNKNKKIFSQHFSNYIKNRLSRHNYNNAYMVRFTYGAWNNCFLTKECVDELSRFFVENKHAFDGFYLKNICKSIIKITTEEDVMINMFLNFKNSVGKEEIDILLKRITNGINNKKIKEGVKKDKYFDILRYSKSDLKDKNKRIQFVKALARRPTATKYLRFKPTLSVDDLHHIAPVMRFNLFKFYYKSEIKYYRRQRNYWWWVKRYNDRHPKYFEIDNIDLKQMESFLFPVSLRKNKEISDWFKKYEYYLICKNIK